MRNVPRTGVRPMEPGDLDEGAQVVMAAFGMDSTDTLTVGRNRRRLAHLLQTDPEGSFVGQRRGRIAGVAQAYVRDDLWCLSMLAVDPAAQGGGLGAALFERALAYGAGRPGLIVGSNDGSALRLYARAGFSLRPTLEGQGRIDRRALPAPSRDVVRGGTGDLEAIAGISRAVRGAAHTSEIAFALDRGAELLLIPGRGFAVAEPGAGVWLLAALDDVAASDLLWSALAVGGGVEYPVRWITAGQDWAVQVAVSAGLRLVAHGALCVRGHPGPLRPFLPSPAFA